MPRRPSCYFFSLARNPWGGVVRFAGKRVLITGSGRGIGAATAVAFAREGADVALLDLREPTETAATIEKLGRKSLPIQGDVSLVAVNDGAVARTVDAFGGLDVFV